MNLKQVLVFDFLCAALAAALAGAAVSQVPITRPDEIWKAPAGAQVSVNKTSGRISITMPSEIDGRAMVDRNFTAWRKTPFAGTGPMPATRVEDPSLPTHTLYFPRALSGRLPVVLWANGGCRNTSVEFTRFLGELASRGYFVIAVGRNDVWFSEFDGSDPAPAAGQPALTTRGGEPVIAGLDWATQENARSGSPYFNKLDLTKVAALGQSCGGGQVWQAARDPRIKAVAAMNSNFPTATSGGIGGGPPPTDGWTVEKLRIPAALFIGGPADVAYTAANTTYAAMPASAQVIMANFPEAGHYGAYARPLPEWVTAVSGWLDWQLKGDARAKALFAGANCGLCRNPHWWYESRNVN